MKTPESWLAAREKRWRKAFDLVEAGQATETVQRCVELVRQGHGICQIAEITGLSRSRVGDALGDPDGQKVTKRKERYRTPCKSCRKPTNPGGLKAGGTGLCAECLSQRKSARNALLVEMWEANESTWRIAEKLGIAETAVLAWVDSERRVRGGQALTMRRSSPKDKAKRFRLIQRRYRQGRSQVEIAKELGTTPASVGNMIFRARREGYDIPFKAVSK